MKLNLTEKEKEYLIKILIDAQTKAVSSMSAIDEVKKLKDIKDYEEKIMDELFEGFAESNDLSNSILDKII